MKFLARALLGVSLLLAFAGCGLSVWGWMENKVSTNATAEPVVMDLAKLEAGEKVVNNHIKLGEHHALYDSSIYSFKTKKKGKVEPGGNVKVDYTFYPIVSSTNPDMKELDKLKAKFGSLDKVPIEIDFPVPAHFVVLVKTKRFKKIDDIPLDFVRAENSIRGLVINEISSLTREEKQLIKDDFPKIDFNKIVILEDGRSPSSSETSIGAMVAGGCCCFAGLIGVVGGIVLLVLSWTRSSAE